MKYGERLKAARLRAKLTQSQLADLCGIQQPSISELETTDAIGSTYTARFARACHVSVDWLSDEIGEMIPITYQTSDPKIIAAAKIMEALPDYAKDAATKDIAQVAELVEHAKASRNGAGS